MVLIFPTRLRGTVSVPTSSTVALAASTMLAATVGGWWLVPQYGATVPLLLILGILAILILVRPFVGLCLLVFSIPLATTLLLGGDVTWTRIVGVLVLAAWILQKLIRRESWRMILSSRVLLFGLLFVLFAFTSLLWEERVSPDFGPIITLSQLLGMALLIVDLVDTRRRLEWMIRSLIVGGTAASLLTYSQVFFQGVVRGGDDVAGNVNQTAEVLVVMVPLAFYLLRTSDAGFWRLVGMFFILSACLAVVATISRASLVILPLILAIEIWMMAKMGGRKLIHAVLIALLGAIILFLAAPWANVFERLGVYEAASGGLRDSEGRFNTGRTHLWLGALAIFGDHPLVGTGYGSFGAKFLTYQFLVPTEFISRFTFAERSPHSTVFGILAELGLVGMFLWILLQTAGFNNLRRNRSNRGPQHQEMWQPILVQAVFLSLAAYTVYSVLQVVQTHKLFWVILGLTEVVRRITMLWDEKRVAFASRRLTPESDPSGTESAPPRPRTLREGPLRGTGLG